MRNRASFLEYYSIGSIGEFLLKYFSLVTSLYLAHFMSVNMIRVF